MPRPHRASSQDPPTSAHYTPRPSVAEVIPAGPDRKRKFLGDLVGTAEIVGDIVSPVIDVDEIEAYRD